MGPKNGHTIREFNQYDLDKKYHKRIVLIRIMQITLGIGYSVKLLRYSAVDKTEVILMRDIAKSRIIPKSFLAKNP